jgi:hypothetical protein
VIDSGAYSLSRSIRLAHGLEPATQAIELWGWCRSCPTWRYTSDNCHGLIRLVDGEGERVLAGGEPDGCLPSGSVETTSGALRWPSMLARAVSTALTCVPFFDAESAPA